MLPAALLLEMYFVEEYSFSNTEAILAVKESLPDPTPQDIEVGFELWDHPEQDRRIACRLFVANADHIKGRVAYDFNITLMGLFRVAEDYPAESLRKMVRYNAPALLYSAAREFIAMTTGRGGAGPLILPTVSFIEMKNAETSKELKEKSAITEAVSEKEAPKKSAKRKSKAP